MVVIFVLVVQILHGTRPHDSVEAYQLWRGVVCS